MELALVPQHGAVGQAAAGGYFGSFGGVALEVATQPRLPLAEERLRGTIHDGEAVNVTVEGDKLVFKQAAAASGALPVS